MSQSKCKLSPWNSRKEQTKRRVHRTGDNHRNYQYGPVSVCPWEAELQGCAMNMLSALQPPGLPVVQKKSSVISENWMSSCLRSVTLEYLTCDLYLALDYHLLDSSGQLPVLLLKKNRTENQLCFSWINFLPTSIVTDERTSFFESR